MTTEMFTEKIKGAIGLSIKAGKCAIGTEACLDKIRSGRGKLLVVANDASENTKDKLISTAKGYGVPQLIFDAGKADFAKLAGKKSDTAAFLITDGGFVKIIEKLGIEIHLTHTEVLN
ncbi:MAG: ribosomal L7Ae/L30e/S12e/Gadd45 family protein [Clostridia bacterium]|nr:ribosomal L7Ae/L30e/S12e/Gadd45 family protein [Clostridia bacterium]MBR4979671.1 ribosomal L7Ae/L30e/S12e/Gadd45 family protein [Clostridia bacterium]